MIDKTVQKKLENEKGLVPIGRAAEILGVSVDTLRRWEKKGLLTTLRPDNKDRYFHLADLEGFKKNKKSVALTAARGVLSGVEEDASSEVGRRLKTNWESMEWVGNSVAEVKQDQLRLSSFTRVIRFFLVTPVILAFVVILLISLFFQFWPKEATSFFGFQARNNTSAQSLSSGPTTNRVLGVSSGQEQPAGSPLSLPAGVSVKILRLLGNSEAQQILLPDEQLVLLRSKLQVTPSSVVLSGDLVFPASSQLRIGSSDLVANLNADFVRGKIPGQSAGNLAVIGAGGVISGLRIEGENILPGVVGTANIVNSAVTTEKLADGAVTQSKLDPSLGLSKIATIAAGTGLSGGGNSGTVTLALDQTVNPTWTGSHIFSGSVSLTKSGTALTVSNNATISGTLGAGGLNVAGFTTFNGITYLFPTSDGSSNQVLSTNGSGGLSWVTQSGSGSGVNYWNLNNGAFYPVNATADLLVGGASTASAKFGLVNVNSGTPAIQIGGNNVLTGTTLGSGVVNSSLTSLGTIGSGVWQGTSIAAGYGGTGLSSYSIGDLIYANGSASLAKLAGVATGNVLLSGGVSTAPTWGKVVLGTHTTGNYVSSLTGTANQVSVSGSTGDVTLSLPQSMGTASTPTFGGLTLTGNLSGTTANFSGAIGGSNLSGTNTGDQTITLSGDVSGSGTGPITTAIGSGKVTNLMLAGSIAASKLIGSDIVTVGTITSGIWNGTAIGTQYGGTGQNFSAITAENLPYFSGTGVLGTTNIVHFLTAGTGIGLSGTTNVTITNNGVTSLAGTTNQVNVSGSTGAVTLSLPQNIGTVSTPTFGGLTLNGGLTGTTATFSGTLGTGGEASYSAKLVLDSATPQINATNNRTLQLGYQNTGRVSFISSGNFIDTAGNLTIGGNLSATGAVTGSNLSGSNTGDQTITLSGDVSGTGVGPITTAIGSGKVTNTMLAGSIANSKLVGTDIATVGTITTGTWNGNVVGALYGGTGQNSVTTGDLLFGSAANTWSSLAGVATGNVLLSGGISTAPSWGKVVLGTHTTGNYVSSLTGTANQVSVSGSTGDITLSLPQNIGTASTPNFGGLTLNGGLTGTAATVSATLGVGTEASVSGKLVLGSLTPQINATNNRDLALGYQNTGRVSFVSNLNYIDSAGNLNINGNFVGTGTINGLIATSGTITSGVWNGTATGTQYGGTGQNFSAITAENIPYFSGTGVLGATNISHFLTAGAGIGLSGTTNVTITNNGVTALAGTTNQVNVSGSTGSVTLSLPQSIGTASTPTFGGLTLNGNLGGTTATFSATLGVGTEASVSGKLILDSVTPQINATNNRSLQLGYQNTGRVSFFNANNYIDGSGNFVAAGSVTAGNGLTVSSGSVTLPSASVANAALQGSGTLSVTAGTGLSGGGSVALGGSTSLSVDQAFSPTWTGLHIFSGNVINTLGLNIASNSGSRPALTVNQNGAADIFTASQNGTPKFVIRNDGNVGIGSTLPTAALDVVGAIKASTAVTAGNGFTVSAGTVTLPAISIANAALQGSGSLTVTAGTGLSGGGSVALGASTSLSVDQSFSPTWTGTHTFSGLAVFNGNVLSTLGLNVASNSGSKPALTVNQNGTTDIFTASQNGTPKFVIKNDGNVGIGSTVPTAALDIVGALKTSTAITAGNGFTVTAGTVTLPTTSIANAALQGSGALTVTAGSGLSGGGSVALGGSTSLSLDQAAALNWTGRQYFTNGVNVASNSGNNPALIVNQNGAWDIFTASQNGTPKFVIRNDGNVGIGSTLPTAALDIVGALKTSTAITAGSGFTVSAGTVTLPATSIANAALQGSGTLTVTAGTGLSGGGSVALGASTSLSLDQSVAAIWTGKQYFTAGVNIASSSGAAPALTVNQNGAWDIFTASQNGTPRFVIRNDGNVGIGSTLPTAALDIVGALKTSTAITAGNGFTVSAGTVTLPSTSVANSALQGSGALTVTAGTGLSGGGSVALGASTSLSVDQSFSPTWTGVHTFSGLAVFNGNVLSTLGLNVASNSGSRPALTVNQNGATDIFTASQNGTPKFVIKNDGNVGIGSTLPTVALDIIGALKTSTAITAGNGFTVSAGTVTLPTTSIANAALQNSGALTVTAGTGLTGGGSVALGASTTLSLNQAVAPTWTGIHYFTGGVNVASNSGVTPALTINQNGVSDLFQASSNGSLKFTISNAGNVGIGTTVTTAALDVVGAIKASTAITAGNGFTVSAGSVSLPATSIANAALQNSGALTVTASTGLSGGGSVALGSSTSLSVNQAFNPVWSGIHYFTGGVNVASNSGTLPALTINQNGASDIFMASQNGATKFVISNSGNVGIGTTIATAALDVVGAGKFSTSLTAGNGFTVSAGTVTLPATSIANAALQGSGALTVTASTGLSGGGSVALGSSTSLSLNQAFAPTWTGIHLFAGGVNIASNSGNAPTLTINQNGAWDIFTASQNGTPKFVVNNSGNVGIGTTVPSKLLAVGSTSQFSVDSAGAIIGTALNIGSGTITSGGINSQTISSVANFTGTVTVATSVTNPILIGGTGTGSTLTVQSSSGVGATDAILFKVGNNGATEAFRVTTAGNIGIGSTAPRAKLDVVTNQTSTASAIIENSTTTSASDGLIIKMGATTVNATTHFLRLLDLNGKTIGTARGASATTISWLGNGIDFAEFFAGDPAYIGNDKNINYPEGTIVCSGTSGVVPCTTSQSEKIVGVVSFRSSFVGGLAEDNENNIIQVGLLGQVPVRMSSDSAPVTPGDPITISDNGIGRKALGRGYIVARALKSWEPRSNQTAVDAFIRPGYYEGDQYLTDSLRQSVDQLQIKVASMAAIINLSDPGLEVMTPKLTANASESPITFDTAGNAHFAGLVTAGKIKADQIEGLEIITGKLSVISSQLSEATNSAAVLGASTSANLNNLNAEWEKIMGASPASGLTLSSINISGQATVAGDLRTRGTGLFEGVVNILDTLTARNIMVGDWADFLGSVIFRGDVNFFGRPTFNADSGGFAVVRNGADRVEVTFAKEYKDMPVVSANLTLQPVKNVDGSVNASASAELEKKVLTGGYNYIITNQTTKGFTVLVSKTTADDLSFSWTAVAVDKAKKFESKQN